MQGGNEVLDRMGVEHGGGKNVWKRRKVEMMERERYDWTGKESERGMTMCQGQWTPKGR